MMGRRNDLQIRVDLCVQRQLNAMRRPLSKRGTEKQYRQAVDACTRRRRGRF